MRQFWSMRACASSATACEYKAAMMGGVLDGLSVWQVIAWIGMAASVWFSLTAMYSGWDFFTRRRTEDEPSPDWTPAVTVLKPLKGLDPELAENLATFCQQEYAPLQIVFGVADARRSRRRRGARTAAAYPALDIELIIDPRLHGTNDKVSNLINMYRAAKHDVLVLADEDIRVPRGYLRRVVAPLRDERIGLVTCMYRARPARANLPTRLWCLTINTTLTPQILVARKVETPTYAFGATMALRRSTLEAVHGFEEIASMLADDYQLGNRIAARGLRLWLSECVVDTILEIGSWRGLLHHQLRRARTNRSHRPIGYFGTVITPGAAVGRRESPRRRHHRGDARHVYAHARHPAGRRGACGAPLPRCVPAFSGPVPGVAQRCAAVPRVGARLLWQQRLVARPPLPHLEDGGGQGGACRPVAGVAAQGAVSAGHETTAIPQHGFRPLPLRITEFGKPTSAFRFALCTHVEGGGTTRRPRATAQSPTEPVRRGGMARPPPGNRIPRLSLAPSRLEADCFWSPLQWTVAEAAEQPHLSF